MSRLEKFLAKPKIIEINGEEFEIWPLTVSELDVMIKMEDESTRAKAIRDLLKLSLKKSIPDCTDEEIDNMSSEYFMDFVNAIIDVNGFADEQVTAIKERLAERQK